MTKDLKTIDLNLLPLETLAEMANDKAEQVERNAKKTVTDAIDCGRYLEAAKEQVAPGKWLEWLGQNWNYSRRTAATYISLADHGKRFPSIEYKSIREAMKMIADENAEPDAEPATAPRSARKPADVVVTTPAETGYRDDSRAATTEGPPDPDPAPKPPTNRKTAKGSEKVPEADKPKTQQVPVEIMIDEPADADIWDTMTFGEILSVAVSKLADDQKKTAAKALRKAADKLDPPTKFVRPDLDEVSAYFTELKAVDPDSFFDFYESKGWLVGKVSMKDWRASARKWVRENHANGKANGNGHNAATRNGRSRGLTAEEVFSAESLGRGR